MRMTLPRIRDARLMLTGSALVVFLALAHLIVDAITSMFSALLPTLQQSFGLTESDLALLVGLLAFSSSFAQPLFGALADRFGRRTVGAFGVMISSVLMSLIPVAPTVTLLAGLLLVGGLGSAAIHPSGAGMARSEGGPRKELAVSLFGMGGTLGVALGPVLVLVALSRVGPAFAPWLMAPGILVAALMWLMAPEQPRDPEQTAQAEGWRRLLIGPVGLLALAATLGGLASVTFIGAMPLWLVQARGVAHDSALIGWTLASFSLAAAMGGVLSGLFSTRIDRRWLVAGSMALAPLPLWAIFRLEAGTTTYYMVVMAAGALIHGSAPVLVVSAQDLAPQAVATASGMLMGLAAGTAGIVYIGVGRLQEVLGLAPAMSFVYLLPIAGALVAFYTLGKVSREADESPGAALDQARAICLCAPCVASGVTFDLPHV